MPKFVVREIQHVIAERTVDAADDDEAWKKFCDGHGEPTKDDGDCVNSQLIFITEVVPTPVGS